MLLKYWPTSLVILFLANMCAQILYYCITLICRPSSKWDLGGDTIHEDQVYETDNERCYTLPRPKDSSFTNPPDPHRWQSTDRLRSLCKGIDLAQSTDDEASRSQASIPRSAHRREQRAHHRIKPWISVLKSILSTKGCVDTKELVEICEKKKAHFTTRQDQSFQGFDTIDELLDCMGVSVDKVSCCKG